ncbi:MAG: serine hydrolase [Actinomycetes bacterium]
MFLIRFLRRIVIAALTLFLLLWIVLAGFRYPNPIQVAQVGFASPTDTPKHMNSNSIAVSTTPKPLEAGVQETLPQTVVFRGKTVTFDEYLKATATNALLIYRDGKLTHEWYAPGISKDQKLPSYSVAKSVVAILAGQFIAEGKLKESDTLVGILPEWKTGTAYDKITIGDLLDMRGGIDVPDDYPSGPSGWGRSIAQMYATTDMNYFIKNHRKMLYEPGTKGEYRSVDTQMVGMVLRKISGKTLVQLAEERLWQPLGAEYGASWSTDVNGGIEKAFCCYNAAPRDYVKLGTLLLAPSAQVDTQWLARLWAPMETLDHKWGYGGYVWHPYANTSMMLGLHEQIVMTLPIQKTVVVKLSANLIDSDEVESARILHEIGVKG